MFKLFIMNQDARFFYEVNLWLHWVALHCLSYIRWTLIPLFIIFYYNIMSIRYYFIIVKCLLPLSNKDDWLIWIIEKGVFQFFLLHISVYVSGSFYCAAPPPRPIPGLLLENPVQKKSSVSPSASSQNFAASPSDFFATVPSKSAPATPASTPLVEEKPTSSWMRFLPGSKPEKEKARANQQTGQRRVRATQVGATQGLQTDILRTMCHVFPLIYYNASRQLIG